jgi:hypothetical protein
MEEEEEEGSEQGSKQGSDGDEEGSGDEEEEEEERSKIKRARVESVETAAAHDDHSVLTDERTHTVHGRIEAKRLLTSEDFALISKLREAQKKRMFYTKLRKQAIVTNFRVLDGTSVSHTLTKGDEELVESNESSAFAVDPETLGSGMSTQKTTKIERISKILSGRKENKFEPATHAGGLTNKEKERKKNFLMVRKGKTQVRSKIRKSNSDQRYEKMISVSFLFAYICGFVIGSVLL